jgi:putative hemolysin
VPHAIESNVLPRLLAFPIPRPIEAAIERLLGIREIESVYRALRSLGDERPISQRLLQHLEVTHRVAERDFDNIPGKGPAVLVLNHPFGILEGAVITTLLSPIRSDIKFLANGILAAIPELRDLLIAVDPMGGPKAARANHGGLRQALEFLERGGLLVVFPAGEVSHFQWKDCRITDPPWSRGTARILALAARRAPGISVIPAHVAGTNSIPFQLLGLLHPRIRTALLARELLNKRKAHVAVRIGSPISVEKLLAIPTDEERIDYLRWRTYLLASRNEYRPTTAASPAHRLRRAPAMETLAPAVDTVTLAREVAALEPAALLARSGELSAYIAPARDIPNLLSEIGRLRETTFRAAGEGTGKRVDVDEFDDHYLHLFLWHETKQEVVGAYRLAGTELVRSQRGVRALYTATLFHYGPQFLERMGPALELGRSFVRAEYQKGFTPLLLLWKAIGRHVARHPHYKVLFGAVSISNQYHSISRELMVSFLERHASLRDWVGLVSVRNPFRSRRRAAKQGLPTAGFDIEDLSAVVSDLEPSRAGVPVLLRQYLKLGGKLLGFNLDPKFSNALDGLILVDLTQTEPKLLERYLGKTETAEFLAYQKGKHGKQ